MAQEPIFKLNFRTFMRSPFTYMFFVLLVGIIYMGRVLITSKDGEITNLKKQVNECDQERVRDKQLLQEIVFQEQLKDHEHVKAPKDEITVQAERYLEDLREFNQHAVDSINEKVDSLEHIKPKFRYIYKVIKADTNGTSIH